ncbi:MAG: nucleotidyltransferase domain-containing protein [Anaerolineales bacterium]|nr:nucleotidyltransferase domain-containing protein [Anaerolineales bacterium]
MREISSLTDQPVRAIQRELARLEDAGLLISSVEGNRKYFRANRQSPVFPDLRALMAKTAGIEDQLKKVLQERSDAIRSAFIFGSFARGSETSTSDIDLMVISDMTSRELSGYLSPLKAELIRELNPVTIRVHEFQENVEKGDSFTQTIMEEPKIFLIGDEDGLQALAGRRTA